MKPSLQEKYISCRVWHAGIFFLLLLVFCIVPPVYANFTTNTVSSDSSMQELSQSSLMQNLTSQKREDVSAPAPEVLALIPVSGSIDQIHLPIYEDLLGGNGSEYVLVKTSLSRLHASGLPYSILDPDTGSGTYAIATRYTTRTLPEITGIASILFVDGKNLVLKADPGATPLLLAAGLDIRWMDQVPMIIRKGEAIVAEEEPAIRYDPRIAEMTTQVNRDFLFSTLGSLSGEQPLQVGGTNYTILTRLTNSGEPLSRATQYAYEYLHVLNFSVSYDAWNMYGYSSRNVIGTKYGSTRPDEIVLVTAHLDSYSDSPNAPGADDDASGSVAVLALADIMSRYMFERTVRFVLFTGEEQGLLGSLMYTHGTAGKDEKIVAVYNMDMIAWNQTDGPVMEIHTRRPSNPAGYSADMQIARIFNGSVDLYGLRSNLTPVILSDGADYSDHYSFWTRGYPAVLAIEDLKDENPYYHKETDRRQYLDMAFFTNLVKASLATVVHIAYPAEPSPEPLVVSFMSDVREGTPPMSVEFTDISTGHPLHWNWSFGDGSGSHEQNPHHTYQGIGRYTVTLEVANTTDKAIGRKPQYITITSGRVTGPNGMIWLSSSPSGALVFVDQVYAGITPLQLSGIRVGIHQVRVNRGGYRDWTGYVQVVQDGCTYIPKVVLRKI